MDAVAWNLQWSAVEEFWQKAVCVRAFLQHQSPRAARQMRREVASTADAIHDRSYICRGGVLYEFA